MEKLESRITSSFRDPSGYVYVKDGLVYRRISEECEEVLVNADSMGLLPNLVESRMLLPFTWVDRYNLLPEQVPFISYPYEWSFSMLKDAALLTLDIQLMALRFGFQLKDASAYNIQFIYSRPIFIDHSSIYFYEDGEPWVGYGQFCRHFLYPLLLHKYQPELVAPLLRSNLDGISPKTVSRLVPLFSKDFLGVLLYLKLNALDRKVSKVPRVSGSKLIALLTNLRSFIEGLEVKYGKGWSEYSECSYDELSKVSKSSIVRSYLSSIPVSSVADLGCNLGNFSFLASDMGCKVIAVDNDPSCIDKLYLKARPDSEILPLVVDLVNPSPALGWGSEERLSFLSRLRVDAVMVLALIHHLAIANNIPLDYVAKLLSNHCKYAIVEWVPKEDRMVRDMLRFREDIFDSYTREGFELSFGKYFRILRCDVVRGSDRSIYLMEVRR